MTPVIFFSIDVGRTPDSQKDAGRALFKERKKYIIFSFGQSDSVNPASQTRVKTVPYILLTPDFPGTNLCPVLMSGSVSALIDRVTVLPTGHNVEMLSLTVSLPTQPTNTNITHYTTTDYYVGHTNISHQSYLDLAVDLLIKLLLMLMLL